MSRFLLVIVVTVGWACERAAPPDAAHHDAATRDAGTQDAAAHDATPTDATAHDATPTDAGTHDAGTHDAATHDAATHDAAPTDAATHDAAPTDAGTHDAGTLDAATHDASPTDAGYADAGYADAGYADAGYTDAGYTDAGYADASRPDTGSPSRVQCLETVTGDLCGRPESIIPGDPVGRPERLMVSRPGPLADLDGVSVSLVGDDVMVKDATHTMTILLSNNTASERELPFACDLNDDPDTENFRFFGRAVVTDPEGTTTHDGVYGPVRITTLAPGEVKAITVQVTPTKEYFYNETKSYMVLRLFGPDGEQVSAVTLAARVEPPPGSPGSVACGTSTFPSTFVNENGGGPFGTFNQGYSRSACCDGVFYPMAECCRREDCTADQGCVDGFCVAKPTPLHRFKGAKSVLVGYGFNDGDSCTVTDPATTPLPPDVLGYYARVNRFFNGMASVLMGTTTEFVRFHVALLVMLPAALRHAVYSPDDVTSTLGRLCPQVDLAAYDLVALDNNASAQWATGFAFPGTNMAIYSHVGLNTSTAVHEIAHLYGCRDYYLDLSGSLQWFDTLYGDGRFDRINPALDAEDPDEVLSIMDLKVLYGCRGFLGWADSDDNGLFDVDEP